MPIYEYECPNGHTVERMMSVEKAATPAAKTTPCESCAIEGQTELAERVLSATPTTFKFHDKKAIKS